MTFLFFGGGPSIASGTILFWLGAGAKTYARLRLGSGGGGGASKRTTSGVSKWGPVTDALPMEDPATMSLSSAGPGSESLNAVKDDAGDSHVGDGECDVAELGVCG